MSNGCDIPEEQLCGCCAGIARETPELITNRPALSAISYRAGRYATFNASMLAALSDPAYPALAPLRTRDSSDFSIALLDAWAVALDILTFYQERFANEAFLGTAIEQRSVIELARLVGYVPSPGVAASAVLAFTLSSAPGSPDNVLIPAGTRVQSVPGPGQKPQVFETSSDITALIGNNALSAQTSIRWKLFGSDVATWIAGTANNINIGDALLFTLSSTGPADVRYVTAISIDSNSGTTQIFWDRPLSSSFTSGMTAAQVGIYVFRKKAALYGAQAPNPLTLSGPNITKLPEYPKGGETDWEFIYTDNSNQINLDGSYPGLNPQNPPGGPPQFIVLTGLGYTSFFRIINAAESNPGHYTLTNKTTQLRLAFGKILTGDTALTLNEVLYLFVKETRNITAYVQSVQLTPADLPITNWVGPVTFPISVGMIAPVEGPSVSIVGGRQIAANQPIGISGKRVRLQVTNGSDAEFIPNGGSGALAVSDGQVFIVDAFPPTTDTASGNPQWTVLTAAGVRGSLIVPPSNMQLLPSDSSDAVVSEAAIAQSLTVNGDISTLALAQPLLRIYDAPTVAVNVNAVEATHGETVQEILGSGDATNPALEFTLKQSPLTYVTAAVHNGSQSTLQVWVNNLQWHEVDNLLSSGPADRVFVTRVNSSGNAVVQFGNGVEGARTPTGQNNIRAVYRKGIGSAGMVSAGQLSQAIDRPQGLKSATNPSPASGAADPASADQVRSSAPLPALTIGRVVSLEDYQNFALAFAGIAKAVATWTWFGNVRGVFLTVAGANGATLQPDDPVVTNLIGALQAAGNPYVPLQVASFVPVLFDFSAAVKVDELNYDPAQVLADVWQSVSNAFAFESRQPGENVVASRIVELIQQTPGVIAVQLRSLGLSGEPASSSVPAILCASGPMPPEGAQMLLLDPAAQGNLGVWS